MTRMPSTPPITPRSRDLGRAQTLLALLPLLAAFAFWVLGASPTWIFAGVAATSLCTAIVFATSRSARSPSVEQSTAHRPNVHAGDPLDTSSEKERRASGQIDQTTSAASAKIGPVGRSIGVPSLRAALDAGEDLVLVFDSFGAVRFSNRAADDFFGGASRPLVDRAIEDLFVQPEILGMHRDASGGSARREEVLITGRQGRRTFQTLAISIGSDGQAGQLVLLLLRDTTDIQSALRLGGDFVASVSHELRTPLASIKGALETLRDSASDDPSMTDRLHLMIATNVDRLEALTADVLRLSQLESSGAAPEVSVIDTKPVLDSIASLLEPLLAERGVRIEFDVSPELATIRTDPRLFELTLKNLVENAGKFAFENSDIRVVARASGSATSWQVIDRGIGIPLNQQSRIFDRFYQVDAARTGSPKRRGTGLGLAIVQNAVKALDGTIRVESVWQQGTTMTIELPGSLVAQPRIAETPV